MTITSAMPAVLPPRAKTLLVLLLLAAGVPALCACGSGGGHDDEGGEPLDLTILHINDHHSRLDAETVTLQLKNAAGETRSVTVPLGGFPRVTAAMDELAAGRANVLKLHAGDAITGDLYYTQSEGEADAAMMNTVCFDAFAIGNHEFDNGDAALAKFIDFLHASPATCKTPVLSANVRPAAGSVLAGRIAGSTVVERGGQQIGIVGLTVAGKTRNASRPDPGTAFADEVASAQGAIDALTEQGVNKIVLLSHLGYQADVAIAARLAGVDLIVGGDSHTLLGPNTMADYGLTPSGAYPTRTADKNGKPVCVVQVWQYGYAVGELRVSFDGRGVVTNCAGTPHVLVGDSFVEGTAEAAAADAGAYRKALDASGTFRITVPSPAAEAVLAPYKSARDAVGRQIAGVASDNLCLRRVPGTRRDPTRSRLGDACNLDPHVIAHGGDIQQLVAQAFLEQGERFGGADLALQNGGGVRVDIAAGEITVSRIYELLAFKNQLVRVTMSGREIKDTLEDAVEAVVGGGSTGAYPYVAGLRFDVDANRARGERVSNLEFRSADGDWGPFPLDRDYRVITSDFLADGGDNYLTLAAIPASRKENTFLDYADSFLQYVRRKSPLTRPAAGDFSTRSYRETP